MNTLMLFYKSPRHSQRISSMLDTFFLILVFATLLIPKSLLYYIASYFVFITYIKIRFGTLDNTAVIIPIFVLIMIRFFELITQYFLISNNVYNFDSSIIQVIESLPVLVLLTLILMFNFFFKHHVESETVDVIISISLFLASTFIIIFSRDNSQLFSILSFIGRYHILIVYFLLLFLLGLNIVTQYQSKQLSNLSIRLNKAEAMHQMNIQRIEHFESIRKFKHDIDNHFLTIGLLIDQNDIELTKNYIQGLTSTYRINHTSYTLNTTLDSFINMKIEQNPDIRFDIISDHDAFDLPIDILISIFGNAIDNSINAIQAGAPLKRTIEIRLFAKQTHYRFEIHNPIFEYNQSSNPIKRSGQGLGIKIMEDMVKRVGGEMIIEVDENKFSVIIIVFKHLN